MSQQREQQPEGERDPATDAQGDVPQVVIAQAQAAAASTNDTHDVSQTTRKHMGHDVPAMDDHDYDLPNQPPPPYGEHFGRISKEQEGFGTNATVGDDGRVNIRIDQRSKKLSDLLVPALRHQQNIQNEETAPPSAYIPPSLGGEEGVPPPPPMNVVIQVVGSRGDVQPFVALGKVLKDTYGHRVRLATHPTFQQFVTENDLDFFSIGGDPAQLMAFMVKNPGLMPGFDTLRSGDVGSRRREVAEYLRGCWRSCFEAGNGLGPEVTDQTIEDYGKHKDDDNMSRPFVADCIIANPPSFAHIHIAEKMGIPLHIMFTMPYSSTQAFPHPLANIQSSNADPNLTNYLSYGLIDMLTWQGLGDVINRFRQKSLGLEPISLVWAPGMLQRLKVPHTYCWSPALIPKPKDWGQTISISGFFFLNLASNYTPPAELQTFLDAGPPPVYIGFGSIVLDDPNAMTQLIFEAVRRTGQRVLLSKGWGGMGADELGIPEGVFMLGNVPHDWLFKHVSCVVHHGGAGTTAAGITAGKPTVVVPFFGDQAFWGAMVARAGAGPAPLPHKELTAEKLADAINFCLKPESQAKARELAAKIAEEKGSDVGAQSFHQMLDVDKLRCTLAPSHAAVWRLRRTQIRLSALAACTLANEGLLDFSELKLFRTREYETDDGPWDPVTGGATALVGTTTQIMMGVADLPIQTLKALKIHPETAKRKSSPADSIKPDAEGTDSASSESQAQSSAGDTKSIDTETTSGVLTPSKTPTPASNANSSFNLQESLSKLGSLEAPSDEQRRSSSLSNTLKEQLANAQKAQRQSRASTQNAGAQPDYMETAVGTGKGVQRMLGSAFKSPMDFSMAITKGFHNVPKLYGDDTVRKSDQVTDLRTGLRAAGKEFGYGLYDGITGLVTQPMKGAQKEGGAGFVKGFAKGIGGIVMKPSAGFWAIPGYTMKGIYREMASWSGSSVQNYIIASRTAQGFDEWQRSSVEEKNDIVTRWKAMQKDIRKKRNPDEIVRDALEEQRRKGKSWYQEKRTRSRTSSRAATKPVSKDESSPRLQPVGSSSDPAHVSETETLTLNHNDDFAEAIRTSVQQSSRGDPEEDAAVERAIQASMAELQRSREQRAKQQHMLDDKDDEDDEELKQALQASVSEAQNPPPQDPLYDAELERALAQSLKEQRQQHSDGVMWAPDEEDEDYQRGIQESQNSAIAGPSTGPPPAYDPGHLAGTTQQEFEEKQSGGEKSQQEITEEQIVLEYVKKQSLLEEEHRKGRG